MNYKTPVLLAAVLFLTGCAVPTKSKDYYDMTTDTLENLSQMNIISEQDLPDDGYTEIGLVNGSSCRRGSDSDMLTEDSTTYRFVLAQLQMSAAEMGAGLITTPQCIIRNAEDTPRYCIASLDCTSRAFIRQWPGNSQYISKSTS